MDKKPISQAIAFWFIIIAIIIVIARACTGPAPSQSGVQFDESTTPPPTEPTATEVPPTATEVPTEPSVPPTSTPTRIPPVESIAPGEKADLKLQPEPALPVQAGIGFALPDGNTPIKVAPLQNALFDKKGMTKVAYVQIGPGAGSIEPGLYEVSIDLTGTSIVVNGKLASETNTVPQHFERVLLKPQRETDLPAIGASILSNAVCFTIGIQNPVGTQTSAQQSILTSGLLEGKDYYRYCSVDETYLSMNDQFPAGLQLVQDRVAAAAESVNLQSDSLQLDLAISEIEDTANINACNENPENCGADILGAPVSSFFDDYNTALKNKPLETFFVTAGFLRVDREMNIDDILIKPGDYKVDYWFRPDGSFIGATLYGKTDEGETVIDQQIPAGEPAFVDADDTQQVTSEISAWKLCRRCLVRQRICP